MIGSNMFTRAERKMGTERRRLKADLAHEEFREEQNQIRLQESNEKKGRPLKEMYAITSKRRATRLDQ